MTDLLTAAAVRLSLGLLEKQKFSKDGLYARWRHMTFLNKSTTIRDGSLSDRERITMDSSLNR